jgi:hypothetical protein
MTTTGRKPPRSIRHGRQSRLADVGAAGQSALDAATVRVRERGLAGEVEARYLAGAGVRTLLVSEDAHATAARAVDAEVGVRHDAGAPEPAPLPELDGLDPACAAVARGAASALEALRTLVLSQEKHAADREGR